MNIDQMNKNLDDDPPPDLAHAINVIKASGFVQDTHMSVSYAHVNILTISHMNYCSPWRSFL